MSFNHEDDVGLFSYGLGHPMKPHRMRMAHDLIAAYGMLNKMQVMVSDMSTIAFTVIQAISFDRDPEDLLLKP